MKKILVTVLAVIMAMGMIFGMTACDNTNVDTESKGVKELPALAGLENPDYSDLVIPAGFKVGLICLHGENSTYDKNFIDAFKSATKELGIADENVIIKINIDEDAPCYDAAKDLVDAGCKVIFADSFGHEDWILQAAIEFPDVQFCHATGTQAHTAEVANFHNAFASIYEGRYLAGVAAGLKIKEMIDNGETVNGIKVTAQNAKIGYVGAHPYAEVISGYTSFYLGAKSIVPTVTMDVSYTGSWYDEAKEKETANKLMEGGCILISQHADSMGAPSACEAKGVPNVSYNGSTYKNCPETFIVSSKINWAPYYKMAIAATIKGEEIPADYTGTLKSGSVQLSEINLDVAAEGTIEKLVEVRDAIVAGTLKIFDTSKFTVTIVDTGNWETSMNTNATVDANGKLTAYMADVDSDANFTGDTNAVENGIFTESSKRSAPYFDVIVDGITIK